MAAGWITRGPRGGFGDTNRAIDNDRTRSVAPAISRHGDRSVAAAGDFVGRDLERGKMMTIATILFLRHVDGIHFAASCWLTIIAFIGDCVLSSS